MSVVISNEILQASQLTSSEFRQEIALHLFQIGRLTLGYASQLADMSPNAFRQFLKQRDVPLYSYDVEDFELDLKNLREFRTVVIVISDTSVTAEGEVFFKGNIRLRVREELDFDAVLITSYGYEVYRDDEKLYWYDDFPHPHDPSLASTLPHHKHVPPDIKRNRVPAPDISFTRPNLPVLIREIEELLKQA